MRALVFGVILVAGIARAEVEVQINVVTPAALEATVIGAPSLPLAKLSISSDGVSVGATKVRTYAQGGEPIAIVFVVNGQEIWMGNDDIEKDVNARYTGALKGLVAGITKSKLASTAPKGSKGEIVTYSSGVQTRLPMGELSKVTGAAFGSQKDYRNKLGTDLVAGIELGLAELHKTTTTRRAMIVIGDGNDTNNDTAKAKLAELKKQAAQDHVELFAITYKGAVSDPSNVITTLVPTMATVNSSDEMATALTAIGTRIADRYYVTFPGSDPRTHKALPWDGKSHDLVVHLDRDTAPPVTVVLPKSP